MLELRDEVDVASVLEGVVEADEDEVVEALVEEEEDMISLSSDPASDFSTPRLVDPLGNTPL